MEMRCRVVDGQSALASADCAVRRPPCSNGLGSQSCLFRFRRSAAADAVWSPTSPDRCTAPCVDTSPTNPSSFSPRCPSVRRGRPPFHPLGCRFGICAPTPGMRGTHSCENIIACSRVAGSVRTRGAARAGVFFARAIDVTSKRPHRHRGPPLSPSSEPGGPEGSPIGGSAVRSPDGGRARCRLANRRGFTTKANGKAHALQNMRCQVAERYQPWRLGTHGHPSGVPVSRPGRCRSPEWGREVVTYLSATSFLCERR
jgi:hypothetical protein